jgi:hypothetical protein
MKNLLLLLVLVAIFSSFSCSSNHKHDILSAKNDSTEVKLKQDAVDSTNLKLEPDNFLNVKLGMTLRDFQERFPNAIKDESKFWTLDLKMMGCGIIFSNNQRLYVLKDLATKAGEKVNIDVFFYNEMVSIIYVEFDNGLFSTDKVFSALSDKYGSPSFSEVNYEYYNTKSYYWLTDNSVLNMLYKSELGSLFLVYASMEVQDILEEIIKDENLKSIE